MSHRKKIILVSASFFIVLFITVLFFIVRYLEGPAQGQTPDNPVSSSGQAAAFNLTPVNTIGKYIVFNYPASLMGGVNTTGSGATIENYRYQYQDIQPWLLTISVNQLTQPSLSYDSGYSLRKADPTRYQESTEAIGPNTFYIMKDVTAPGFAQVAFVLHGTYSADISLYGDDLSSLDNLQNTFTMVLHSFQWKQ